MSDTKGMSHEDMSMFTPAKWAIYVSLILGAALVTLLILRATWPTTAAIPDPASASRVGYLLMGKYMMMFEGAGLLILLGVFGGVLAARPGRHTGARDRRRLQAASEAQPEPIDVEREHTAAPAPAAAHEHAHHGGGDA